MQTGFWNGCMRHLHAWPRCQAWAIIGKTWRMRGTASGRCAYVIAYRDQTSPLEIIAIVHGARQLEAFFQHRIGGQASEATE